MTKRNRIVEPGSHKTDELGNLVRELRELEAELRRAGSMKAAKTCAKAATVINAARELSIIKSVSGM